MPAAFKLLFIKSIAFSPNGVDIIKAVIYLLDFISDSVHVNGNGGGFSY